MGRLLDFVSQVLRKQGVVVEPIPQKPAVRFTCLGDSVNWVCVVQERQGRELLCYAVLPARAPEEARPAVAEFITRVNYGMAVGNFELDYGDGEIRFKTYVASEDGRVDEALVGPMLALNRAMMNRYSPGFPRVFRGADPGTVVAEIESE
ncbi:MAG: YbjN domain-containing protein [Candidatus Eremiobacterota bacterium]